MPTQWKCCPWFQCGWSWVIRYVILGIKCHLSFSKQALFCSKENRLLKLNCFFYHKWKRLATKWFLVFLKSCVLFLIASPTCKSSWSINLDKSFLSKELIVTLIFAVEIECPGYIIRRRVSKVGHVILLMVKYRVFDQCEFCSGKPFILGQRLDQTEFTVSHLMIIWCLFFLLSFLPVFLGPAASILKTVS